MSGNVGHPSTFGFMLRKDQSRKEWIVWESPTGILHAWAKYEMAAVLRTGPGVYAGGMIVLHDHFARKKADGRNCY